MDKEKQKAARERWEKRMLQERVRTSGDIASDWLQAENDLLVALDALEAQEKERERLQFQVERLSATLREESNPIKRRDRRIEELEDNEVFLLKMLRVRERERDEARDDARRFVAENYRMRNLLIDYKESLEKDLDDLGLVDNWPSVREELDEVLEALKPEK